jgi:hypothetical protein
VSDETTPAPVPKKFSGGLRMAKATPEDIENAFELASVLDQIERGDWPYLGDEEPEDAPERIDDENIEHLQHVYELFRTMARRGGLWRIVMGFDMVLHSDLLNPAVDYIEVNPVINECVDKSNAADAAANQEPTA